MHKLLFFLLNIFFIFPVISMELTENEKQLFAAIKAGNLDEVTKLIATGLINIDKKDGDGNTPLMIAVDPKNKPNIAIINAILNEIPNALADNKGVMAINIAQQITDNKDTILNMLRNAAKQYAFYQEIIKPMPNLLMVDNTLNQITQVTNSTNPTRNFLVRAIHPLHNKDLVSKLIAKEADVNQILRDGTTPLMIAIENRAIDIINTLLAKGADPLLKNPVGKTAFDLVRAKLLEKGLGAKPKKEFEQIKVALQTKSEPLLVEVIQHKGVEAIKDLIPKFFSAKKALEIAINNNNPVAVQRILNIFPELVEKIDEPIDNADNTALMLAIKNAIKTGSIATLHIILKQVPDPSVAMNLVKINTGDTDQVKKTKDAINELLEKAQEQYNLYKAIYDGEALIKIEPLITANVTLAIPNENRNPLVLAISAALPDIVKLLVQKKPDKAGINQLLTDGTTPFQVAQKELASQDIKRAIKAYEAIVQILQQAIGSPATPPVTPPALIDDKPLLVSLQKFRQSLIALQTMLKAK